MFIICQFFWCKSLFLVVQQCFVVLLCDWQLFVQVDYYLVWLYLVYFGVGDLGYLFQLFVYVCQVDGEEVCCQVWGDLLLYCVLVDVVEVVFDIDFGDWLVGVWQDVFGVVIGVIVENGQ